MYVIGPGFFRKGYKTFFIHCSSLFGTFSALLWKKAGQGIRSHVPLHFFLQCLNELIIRQIISFQP